MKITAVTVRRLKTLGNYNNIAIEATAVVEEGQDPAAVRAELDRWVEGQVEAGKSVADMTDQAMKLQDQIEQMKSSKEFIRADIQKLRDQRDRLSRMSVEEFAALKDDPELPF